MAKATIRQNNSLVYNDLTRLNMLFNRTSMYTVWVEFKCGGLTLNTSDNSITYNSTKHTISGNLISSLRFQKSGAGEANAFTLTIFYSPEIGDPINIIDEALAGTLQNAMHSCTLRYGYNLEVYTSSSPTYTGSVFDYSVEAQNSILTYTFTGYSNLATKSSLTFDIPAIDDKKKLSEIINHAYSAYQTTTKEKISSGITTYDFTIEFDDKNSIDNYCVKMAYGGATDINFFQFLDELLACARDDYTSNYLNADGTVKHFGDYYYTIEDSGGKSKVVIHRRELCQTTLDVSYQFFWGGRFNKNPGSNLVQNFRTDFKGAINLALSNAGTTTSYNVDEYGNKIEYDTGINGKSISGEATGYDVARTNNQYIIGTQYSYTATLTTMGVPTDIPIGTYIRVSVIIAQQVHNMSGIYMVTKTEDNLTLSGYTTTWSLIKICNNDGVLLTDEAYMKQICKSYHEIDVQDGLTTNRVLKNVIGADGSINLDNLNNNLQYTLDVLNKAVNGTFGTTVNISSSGSSRTPNPNINSSQTGSGITPKVEKPNSTPASSGTSTGGSVNRGSGGSGKLIAMVK